MSEAANTNAVKHHVTISAFLVSLQLLVFIIILYSKPLLTGNANNIAF